LFYAALLKSPEQVELVIAFQNLKQKRVFPTTLRILEKLIAACQRWKCTDYRFMHLSPIANAREFYALLPQIVQR